MVLAVNIVNSLYGPAIYTLTCVISINIVLYCTERLLVLRDIEEGEL